MKYLIDLLQISLILTFLQMSRSRSSAPNLQNLSYFNDTFRSANISAVNKKVLTVENRQGPMKSTFLRQLQRDVFRMDTTAETLNNSNTLNGIRRLAAFRFNSTRQNMPLAIKLRTISSSEDPRGRDVHMSHSKADGKDTNLSNLGPIPSLVKISPPRRTREHKKHPKAYSSEIYVKADILNEDIPCPKPCNCFRGSNHAITFIDCSSRGLISVPLLPSTTEVLYLQNNDIDTISCHSFQNLTLVTKIDISHNTIRAFAGCSFSSLVSLKYLNLSNCGLESLPHGVFSSLRNLIALDLSINNLHSIDGQIFLNMTHLETLNLYHNNLNTIRNRTFQGLTSLQFLSLQRNLLKYNSSTFEPLAFEGLPSLQVLYIQGNQVDLPETFTYPDQALSLLPWLQELRLDGQPRPLGPGFASLTNLSRLDFSTDHQHDIESFCVMGKEIPSNFYDNLATRQPLTLNMSSCSLEAIPPYLFRAVPTIHTLDLSGNHYLGLNRFEIGSKGLQNSTLTILNLSHIVKSGRMSRVRNTTFQYLTHTNLKVLILEECEISKISPKAITYLPRTIEFISLQDNRIQYAHFIEPLILLYNLKTLKFSSQLHYSATLDSTTEISFLNKSNVGGVAGTQFNKDNVKPTKRIDFFKPFVPNTWSDFERNKTFHYNPPAKLNGDKTNDFCGDLESSFPPKRLLFSSPTTPLPAALEYVYASDINTKYSLPRLDITNNQVLKYLDYSKNGAKCFGGPFTGVPSLQHLDLSYNWCIKVNPLMFSEMSSLTTLLLHHNVLGQSLSDDVNGVTFSTLSELKTLDLSFNAVKQLSPKAFARNSKLRNLNLSHNDLSHFHSSLADVKRLEDLDLSVNNLEQLSEETCRHLVDMKSRNTNFTVRLKDNRFQCDCANLGLLKLLIKQPKIFYDLESFQCYLANGSAISYDELEEFVPYLVKTCIAETTFIIVVIIFVTFVAALAIFSLYYYKRWQWRYLYYLGKSQLHIGSTFITYKPVAHTFITYDQEERTCRSFIREVVLPTLQQLDVTYVLGEVDFSGGPLASSIAGAVASTQKTLVFLSRHIFQDFHRELELNLAIMHELYMRKRVVVPVLLLNYEDGPTTRLTNRVQSNQRVPHEQDDEGTESEAESTSTHSTSDNDSRHPGPQYLHRETPTDLIDRFPPAIATYLRGQAHRCLLYDGDSEQFWSSLKEALFDEC